MSREEQLAAVKGEHKRTLLQRRIEATDRQIDALVYKLYRPTKEEIGIRNIASSICLLFAEALRVYRDNREYIGIYFNKTRDILS